MKIDQRTKFSFYLNGEYNEFLKVTKWIDENKILSDNDTIWWSNYEFRYKKNIYNDTDDYLFVGADITFFDSNDAMLFRLRWG